MFNLPSFRFEHQSVTIKTYGCDGQAEETNWCYRDQDPTVISSIASAILKYPYTLSSIGTDAELYSLADSLQNTHVSSAKKASGWIKNALQFDKWAEDYPMNDRNVYYRLLHSVCIQGNNCIEVDEKIDLPTFPWAYLGNCRELEIHGNNTEYISAIGQFLRGIEQAEGITHLTLSELFFSNGRIPQELLHSLKTMNFHSLTHLKLISLRLTEIPAALKQFHCLKSLYLDGNAIRKVPNDLPSSLKKLVLVDNPIEEFKSGIQVTSLRFSIKKNWPKNLGTLTCLEKLSVSGIPDSSFPPELAQLTRLHSLTITRVSSEDIPVLQSLSSLEMLLVIDPPIPEITSLTQLRALKIGKNAYGIHAEKVPYALPNDIWKMKRLSYLHFGNTYSVVLPPEIVLCRHFNLMQRHILVNQSLANSSLLDDWLERPFISLDALPSTLVSLPHHLVRAKLPISQIYGQASVKRRVLNAIVDAKASIKSYEIETSNDKEDTFRTHAVITLPIKTYFEFFMCYLLAFSKSVAQGKEFQKDALQKLFIFLKEKCPPFYMDNFVLGSDFQDAFIDGKIWYNESIPEAALVVMSAWLPPDEEGNFWIPPHKKQREAELNESGFN